MTESLIEGSDWRSWMEQFEDRQPSVPPTVALESSDSRRESWDHTDRPLAFSQSATKAAPVAVRPRSKLIEGPTARTRWLEEHRVTTEFLDGGIGCCWFAQQGDDEPVCGETEDAAIAKLADQNGLPWPEGLLIFDPSRS